MKKKLLFLPIALLGLVLAGCNASELQDNFTEADQVVETPWEDYVLPASGIEFADGEDSITLKKGETHTYSYQIQPRGATSNSLNWASNDVNVATVDKGVVTAVGGGDATITASSPDGAFDPVELEVNVVVPLTNFALTIPERLDWSEQYTFPVSYEPSDTTERDLAYEISEASVEGLVSVNEQGVVTTTNQNGTATLKVTGANNIVKTYTLNISTIPVTDVSLANAGHELEVNHSLQLSATVSPSNATELGRRGVRYYSRNTAIATVDELTGVVLGVAPGTVQIYAECGGIQSDNYEIEVYKVLATSVNITTSDFTLSNNNDNGLSKQLEYPITVDRAGHTEPSAATVSFFSSNERVATVSDSGLVTAVGPGEADISIQVAQEGQELREDSVHVEVVIVSTTLSINGGNSFYNDSTLTLTASLTPGNVSNNEIIWTVTQDPEIVNYVADGGTITLTPKDTEVTGTVKVKATNTGGASNEITVTVADRPAEFTAGHHYIVGAQLFNTGESRSIPEKSSWTNAKYAYHFTNKINDTTGLEEYMGTIFFNENDQFRYFVGTEYWVPAWEQQEGWAEKGWHIEQDGANNAFVKGQMRFVKENESHVIEQSEAADANIQVLTEGWYNLYAKLYKKENAADNWYSLYIEKVPDLSVELDEIEMGYKESYQIKAHDWIKSVSYEIKSGSDYITLSPTGLVTSKEADGVAIVTVTDGRGQHVDVTFTIQSGSHLGKTVYLNANGMFDSDNVVPFVHSWGGEGAKPAADVKMNLVEGQTIIYSASLPIDHTKLDFVRCAEGSTSIVWEEIYNQTEDQDIPAGENPMFTMTGWSIESDSSHRTYVAGSWSTFDSSQTYVPEGGSGGEEDPHGSRYVMYGNDPVWNYLPLETNPGNQDEVMGSIALEANTEFVIKMGQDDWRHFENNKAASSKKVIQGSEANAEGTLHNFKVTEDGTYSFYIMKDKDAEGGRNVYVGFTSSGGGSVTPNVVRIYFCDAFNWATGANKMYAYVWGDGGAKVAWPGEEATLVGVDSGDKNAYSFDVDLSVYDNIIFHVGDTKTVDIDISGASNNQGYQPNELSSGAYTVLPYTYTPKAPVTTYTVSFNANGGTGSIDPVPGVSGSYTLPDGTGLTAPSGQTFVGWKVNNEGETKAAGASITVEADITLYAQYVDVASTYTVSFDANGGSGTKASVSGVSGSYTLPDSTGLTAPEGYHFLGWALTADGTVITEATITVNEDITLYAKWEIDHVANNVTIHFTNAFRWANVKAYAFNNTTHVEKTAFPGEAMTRVGVNSQYQAVYSYTVDISLYTEIVFTNGESGDSNQTVDIDISSATNTTGYYLAGRVDNDESKKATVGEYIYEDSLLINESELFFFTNNNNWPQIHAYRFNSTTSAEKTTWGDAPVMTYLCNNDYGQGIYVIRIDDLNDYNAIIFRDTANHQTVDIILDSAEFAGHNAFYLNGEMSGSSYQVAATDDNYVIY